MRILVINTTLLLLTVAASFPCSAQGEPSDSLQKKNRPDKAFFWGATFNNALVTFKGDNLPQDYFWRPGLGITLKTEWFFHRNIGVSAGFTFQAKGAGIITPDNYKGLGDPDSTHRARIKFYNLELPLVLILRGGSPIKGTRLRGEFGVIPSWNVYSKYTFLSIEDGFHFVEDQSDQYYKNDLFFAGAFGIDIDAANACVFQVHLYGNWGTKNVYDTSFYPNAEGRNVVYGIRLGWMF
jgi:hypothetical protein